MLAGLHCKCGRRLKVPESKIGKTGHCPACRAALRLIAPGFRAGADTFEGLLEIAAGPERAGEFILLGGPGPIEIGRQRDKHLLLTGPRVSRAHCRLVRTAHGWRIEDTKSTAGVFINGRRIEAADLQPNARLRIGDYELSYHSPGDAQPESDGTLSWSEFHEPALAAAATPTAGEPPDLPGDGGLDADQLHRLSDGDVPEVAPVETSEPAPVPQAGGPVCPSCQKSLAPGAKICVACGIDLKTGRAILTSHATDLDTVYENAAGIISWVSWIIRFGIYPVASEAFGLRKPHCVRAIAAITILTSFWFGVYDWTDSPKMQSLKNWR